MAQYRYIEDELPLDLVNAEIRFTDEGVAQAERLLYADTAQAEILYVGTAPELTFEEKMTEGGAIKCDDCHCWVTFPQYDMPDGKYHLECPSRSDFREQNLSHY